MQDLIIHRRVPLRFHARMVQQAAAAGLLAVTVDERVIANFFLTNSHHGVIFWVNPERFGPERFALHGVSARM